MKSFTSVLVGTGLLAATSWIPTSESFRSTVSLSSRHKIGNGDGNGNRDAIRRTMVVSNNNNNNNKKKKKPFVVVVVVVRCCCAPRGLPPPPPPLCAGGWKVRGRRRRRRQQRRKRSTTDDDAAAVVADRHRRTVDDDLVLELPRVQGGDARVHGGGPRSRFLPCGPEPAERGPSSLPQGGTLFGEFHVDLSGLPGIHDHQRGHRPPHDLRRHVEVGRLDVRPPHGMGVDHRNAARGGGPRRSDGHDGVVHHRSRHEGAVLHESRGRGNAKVRQLRRGPRRHPGPDEVHAAEQRDDDDLDPRKVYPRTGFGHPGMPDELERRSGFLRRSRLHRHDAELDGRLLRDLPRRGRLL
mmetsp:Transcript_21226/g.50440  ORF Transcript_21226/g.50440 Transcript_21226/m.50440 type:complete len:353 (+) Transcript_21226:116-1174(+)